MSAIVDCVREWYLVVVEPETTVLVVIVVGSAVVLMVSGALKAVPFSVPAKVPLKV